MKSIYGISCRFIHTSLLFNRVYSILVLQGPTAVNYIRACNEQICNRLNEVAQYKTVCSCALLLLHNTIGSILSADETRMGCKVLVIQRIITNTGSYYTNTIMSGQ